MRLHSEIDYPIEPQIFNPEDVIAKSEQLGHQARFAHNALHGTDFEFIGNVWLDNGLVGDVYHRDKAHSRIGRAAIQVHTGSAPPLKQKLARRKQFVNPRNTSVGMVSPLDASEYETFMTNIGVEVVDDRMGEYKYVPISSMYLRGLQLAVACKHVDEASLVPYIRPKVTKQEREVTFRDPRVTERVARLQGFANTETWQKAWAKAMEKYYPPEGDRLQYNIHHVLDVQKVHEITRK